PQIPRQARATRSGDRAMNLVATTKLSSVTADLTLTRYQPGAAAAAPATPLTTFQALPPESLTLKGNAPASVFDAPMTYVSMNKQAWNNMPISAALGGAGTLRDFKSAKTFTPAGESPLGRDVDWTMSRNDPRDAEVIPVGGYDKIDNPIASF